MDHAAKQIPALGVLVSSSSSDPAVWYFARDHKHKAGPVSWGQLKHLAAVGELLPTDLLWQKGMDHWVPAAEVKAPHRSGQGSPKTPPRTAPTSAAHGKQSRSGP